MVDDGSGSTQPTSAVTFQRLLFEVFSEDTSRLRSYCADIDAWSEGVAFLDSADGGGWDLLDALLSGESECSELLDVPFLSQQ